MNNRKRIGIVLVSAGIVLLSYIVGYLHFVHPKPVRAGGSGRESVEPVFRTARHSLIRLFRPAVAVDQALFPGRWDLERFQLPPVDLAGLRKMAPFRARVEIVSRTTPHNTGVSTLHLGLRLENGCLLPVVEPGAAETMFSLAGSPMDTRLHEFPSSWFNPK